MTPVARRSRAAVVVAATLLTACTSGAVHVPTVNDPIGRTHPGSLIVASFNFPESEILSYIYAKVLKAKGYPVQLMANVGPREVVEPALYRGLIDVIPEYAGSALEFLSAGANQLPGEAADTLDRLRRVLSERGLVALRPATAEDANAIVVTRDTADLLRLKTISDLSRTAHGMTFGGPPECPQRIYCLYGLRQVYHLSFRAFIPLDTGGPQTLYALLSGRIQAGLLFTSDPAIEANRLVILRDDQGLQAPENVVPVIRASAVRRYGPGVTEALDWVSLRLTTAELRGLNGRALAGKSPADVASEWLSRQGFQTAANAKVGS